MKHIKILGPGCARCHNLAAATETVAQNMNLEYQLEKVTDLRQIMSYGVMITPALVVDGVVKVTGRVPGADEIQQLLT
jgi:small redox-active disulfide protein 2